MDKEFNMIEIAVIGFALIGVGICLYVSDCRFGEPSGIRQNLGIASMICGLPLYVFGVVGTII